MRTLFLGGFAFLLGCAYATAAQYQDQQREQAYQAWRERTFFNSSSPAPSPVPQVSPPPAVRDYSAEQARAEFESRVAAEYKREVAAWEAKLQAQREQERLDAKQRRLEAYRQARLQAGGRLPLHEPPDFSSVSETVAWYFAEAKTAGPDDSFVLYSAASMALADPARGVSLETARQWLERADPSWPEIQAALGRMLLLGEGGPANPARAWPLLRAAEKVLESQSWQARGRTDLYFAMGRGLAEGIGVPADPVAALWALDHSVEGNQMHRPSYRYLLDVFWPAHAATAARIMILAERKHPRWNYAPFASLSAASEVPLPAPSAPGNSEAKFTPVTVGKPPGNPALQAQDFGSRIMSWRRASQESDSVREAIAKLENDGNGEIAVERLLPDQYGGMLEPRDAAEYSSWLAKGKSWLDSRAAGGDPRAMAGQVWLALHPPEGAPNFGAAEKWAEEGLKVGDPWGALFIAREKLLRSSDPSPERETAVVWLTRVDGAEDTPFIAHHVAEFFSLPGDFETEAILRTHYRSLGAKNGNAMCALNLAQSYENKLSLKLIESEADEALWSKAEHLLENTREKITDLAVQAELTAALAAMRDRHAHYDERRRAAHESAVAAAEAEALKEKADEARARSEKIAEIRKTSVGAEGRLVALWTRLRARLADPAAKWDWDFGHSTYPIEEAFIEDDVRRSSQILAACANAERALEGEILQAVLSLEQGEAGLGAEKSRELRAAMVKTFTGWAEKNAGAASVLARSLAPAPEYPLLARTLESERHTIKWLRHSLQLGREEAIFDLINHFAEQDELRELYEPADERAHEDGSGPEHIAAIVALLPKQAGEEKILAAKMADAAARRKHAEQIVAVDAAGSSQRILDLIAEWEKVARSAAQATKPFSSWEEQEPTGELADLADLPRTLAVEQVRVVRALAGSLRGEPGAIVAAAELTGKYDPKISARFTVALRTLVEADAKRGSLPAIQRLIAWDFPRGDELPLPGWPIDERDAVKWSRQALLAGAADSVVVPPLVYAGESGSRVYDSSHYRAWKEFVQKFQSELGEEPDAARVVAFAKLHLPEVDAALAN